MIVKPNNQFHAGGHKSYIRGLLGQRLADLRKINSDSDLTHSQKKSGIKQLRAVYKHHRRNSKYLLF